MAFPNYVDISQFQPKTVDWTAYVAWSKSVDGTARVAVRASEGTGVGDTNYAGYISGIRAADPQAITIHYHYSYPQYNAAIDEVNWMATQVDKVGLSKQDVIMLDFEENVAQGTAEWVLTWLEAAKAKFGEGVTVVLYSYLSLIQQKLTNPALAGYPLILAEWNGSSTPPAAPTPWKSLWAWQYTDNLSSVPGFGGAAVDADYYLATPPPPKPVYTYNGQVISLQKSYQLMISAESQDQCGPWTASELKYAGLPGQPPRGSVDDVHKWAVAEYDKWIGPDVTSDQNGSSIDNMHEFFKDAGYHWWDITAISPTSDRNHDNAEVIAALNAGYPVVVTVNEQSVIRPNGSNPYPWQPRLGPVNHIFTIVGHTPDGYFLVDDELNAEDSAWPDVYSQSHLEIHWSAVIGLVGPDPATPWFAPIPSGDPTSWPAGFNGQLFTGETTMGVPAGWKDDGSTLTAPNGHTVVLGFRQWVLDHNWDPNNWPMSEEFHADPLEYSNPSLGAGQKQCFRWTTLEYTTRVFEAWQGQEAYVLLQMYEKLLATPAGIPADLQTAINAVVPLAAEFQKYVK